jgi:hypothetical protein
LEFALVAPVFGYIFRGLDACNESIEWVNYKFNTQCRKSGGLLQLALPMALGIP